MTLHNASFIWKKDVTRERRNAWIDGKKKKWDRPSETREARASGRGNGSGRGGEWRHKIVAFGASPPFSPLTTQKPRLDTIPSTKEERELRGGL